MNPYGFDWGPLRVERLAHVEGESYVLRIYTDHDELLVRVTEKGRKAEAYRQAGKVRLVPEGSDRDRA